MAERLGNEKTRNIVSNYERNKSIPPIEVLLAYARTVNVQLEQIVDDDQDLRVSPSEHP